MSGPSELTFRVTTDGLAEIFDQIHEPSREMNERNHGINERNHGINERNHEINGRNHEINERSHEINERNLEINKRNHEINERNQQLEQDMNQRIVENHIQSKQILMELAEIKDLLKRQSISQPVQQFDAEQLPHSQTAAAQDDPPSSSETLRPDGSVDGNADYGLTDRADDSFARAASQSSQGEVIDRPRKTFNKGKHLRERGSTSSSATSRSCCSHDEGQKVQDRIKRDSEDTDMENAMPPKRPRLSGSPGRKRTGRPIKPFSKPVSNRISSSTTSSVSLGPLEDGVAFDPSYPAAGHIQSQYASKNDHSYSLDETKRAGRSASPWRTEKKRIDQATPIVQNDAQSADSTPGMGVFRLFNVRTDTEQRQNSRLRNETSWLKSQHEAAGFRAEYSGLTRSQFNCLTKTDRVDANAIPACPGYQSVAPSQTTAPASPAATHHDCVPPPASTVTQDGGATQPQPPAPTAIMISQSSPRGSSTPLRRSGRSAAPAQRYEGYLDTTKVIEGPAPR